MPTQSQGLGALAAILDALDRGKAIVPTGGGVLVEFDAVAYTFESSGTAMMVCDADDVEALRSLAEPKEETTAQARDRQTADGLRQQKEEHEAIWAAGYEAGREAEVRSHMAEGEW